MGLSQYGRLDLPSANVFPCHRDFSLCCFLSPHLGVVSMKTLIFSISSATMARYPSTGIVLVIRASSPLAEGDPYKMSTSMTVLMFSIRSARVFRLV